MASQQENQLGEGQTGEDYQVEYHDKATQTEDYQGQSDEDYSVEYHEHGVRAEDNECQVVQHGTLREYKEGKSTDEEDVGERTFPKFMRLPAELRTMVWGYALPPPRTVQLFCSRSHLIEPQLSPLQVYVTQDCTLTDSNMPLAAVCTESRDFIQSVGYTITTMYTRDMESKMWFCHGRDGISDCGNLEIDAEGNIHNMTPSPSDSEGSYDSY